MGWKYLTVIGTIFFLLGIGYTIKGSPLGLLYIALGIVLLCAAFLVSKR